MDYRRGSEWRRWDLHLHTPFTKKEDQYAGITAEEKWDNFYQTIQSYVGDGKDPQKAISAIAITDYLSIKNYIAVRQHNRLPACIELLLPNVELRMTPIAKDSPINIHCIFSPDIADYIDDRFFAKLEFEYGGNKYSATDSQLTELGRAYCNNSSLPEEEAQRVARGQYVLSFDILSKVFKNDPELRNHTIIAVSNKSSDGVSGTTAHSSYFEGDISQLDATRRSIYQFSDMIFSANPSDINYFLGKKADDIETVKRKCGSLMPCIHGCDAHTNERVFEPADKRYCWIKADPTFNGLKQVLYEPKERVCISPHYPELKNSYNVIDRIEIANNADFDPHPIELSDKLTCIIGGKSTGKSLLLHNIAFAIDASQVKAKEETAATNVKQIPELKVYWRDGVCSGTEDTPRKIVYIPQTYLNRLSDEKEETTEIDSIIQDIILQDENAFRLYNALNENISAQKQKIAKTVVDFIQTVSERNAVLDREKEVGARNGINKEIEDLTNQLEVLSKEYNVTEDEVKSYQIAMENVQKYTDMIKDLEREKSYIVSIDSVMQRRELSQKSISRFMEQLTDAIKKTQAMADAHWRKEREQLISRIDLQVAEAQGFLDNYKVQVETLKPKMEGNEQIGRISALIVDEREKLERLTRLDTELQKLQKTYDDQLGVLTSAFSVYEDFYKDYVNGINENYSEPIGDLQFRVERVFRTEQFTEKVLDIINRKSVGRFSDIDLNHITEKDFLDTERTRSFIESVLANSLESLQLKMGHTLESALRDIFTDWNNVDYIVSMDRDSIDEMSPGKKALILLRLLISLAESKCPILIDQPEDDLDNRSIFDELIEFIKTKKVDRQIIVATHNANIVLGGDAELILVANQNGKNSPNCKYRFEYRGGSIENNSQIKDATGIVMDGILNQKGIQTHICEILEGGERAFDLRKNKYRFIHGHIK